MRFGLDLSQGKFEGNSYHSQHPGIKNVLIDVEMPGFDLCLLASSDHSIHTYGTFGLWGSLLAGGDVIATTGTTGKEEAATEVHILFFYFNLFKFNYSGGPNLPPSCHGELGVLGCAGQEQY